MFNKFNKPFEKKKHNTTKYLYIENLSINGIIVHYVRNELKISKGYEYQYDKVPFENLGGPVVPLNFKVQNVSRKSFFWAPPLTCRSFMRSFTNPEKILIIILTSYSNFLVLKPQRSSHLHQVT